MILDHITVTGYKPYGTCCRFELRPITVLVGPNNSGKSALARLIPLVAGSLLADAGDEPIPLESLGIRHGTTFHDLLTRRAMHGKIQLQVGWQHQGKPLVLEVDVQAQAVRHGADVRQVVVRWRLEWEGNHQEYTRPNLDEPRYQRPDGEPLELAWSGVWPRAQSTTVPDWIAAARDALRKWARGIHYLQSPRAIAPGPVRAGRPLSLFRDISGSEAAEILACDDALESEADAWFDRVFDVGLEVKRTGDYAELILRAPDGVPIPLAQGGQGLSQVLPVFLAIQTAANRGDGVDLVEHPEAELHPGVHGEVAELLLTGRADLARPLVVETHAEMLLLRIRRRVAEGSLPPDSVAVYWVDPTAEEKIREVRLLPNGEVENWPEGVFYEDYEEVLAIRRAARKPSGTP